MSSRIDVDEIRSKTTNGDLTLDPNGTGKIDIGGHELVLDADGDTSITADTDDQIDFKTGGTDRMHIDASGKVGIGDTPGEAKLHVKSSAVISAIDNVADEFVIENNGACGMTILSANNDSGFILFGDNDYNAPAGIRYEHANNAFSFRANSAWDRVRIDSSGQFMVNFGQTTDIDGKIGGSSGNTTFGVQKTDGIRIAHPGSSYWNRFSDGVILYFRSAGTNEGSIQVSGSTVSFNGGHLSRWSQLADNTRDASIVKGTVMTNLDQMAEWTKDGVTEDNEQLNCMAVSSVEGDANVAGVFVSWDDDDTDYHNDMNVAMTGDMVIRIASGTTVARGDLLMSAGDGTAKPQGDDIVRSKTIAKVTSTNVSHTYDDGSYLVPCVLMAC